MFISTRGRGYYGNDGQQHSGRGNYLALFSWNDFKAQDELRAACADCQAAHTAREAAIAAGRWEAYNWAEHCNAHLGIRSGLPLPKYPNGKGKLWATTRACSLHQCGHFMMGTIRIGGKSITVSGPIGHDGLPLDLQDVPQAWRNKLVELPEDVATAFWGDNGHNDVGRAAKPLREWAYTALVHPALGRRTEEGK
jgi:hypothetical protein